MLYAYNTSLHSSTRTSPFKLIFGRDPRLAVDGIEELAYDTVSYEKQLKERLGKYERLVKEHLLIAMQSQKDWYDTNASRVVLFRVGEPVWLSIPIRSKLQPRWEGGWTVMEILNRVNVRIRHKDTRERVVHVNRLRLRYNRNTDFSEPSTNIQITRLLENNHNYSLLEQESEDIESNNSTQPVPRRSGRIRRLPQYLEDYVLY